MEMKHTDREFEAELNRIREQVAHMVRLVEGMLADGMRAFESYDAELAGKVIDADAGVDRLEMEIDELCLRVLARRQPMGADLRIVTTAMKLVTDIERIGDLCVNIAERTLELAGESKPAPMEDISIMAREAGGMLSRAALAFTASDPAAARRIIQDDRMVDVLYVQAARQLLNLMTAAPESISRATRLLSVAKYLERIGDHATNLAEMTVFMTQGRDIRHSEDAGTAETASGKGILFLCVHNSARSQMAEGWARKLLPANVEVWSAGSDPAECVHPRTVAVMREAGVDISGHRPKRISDIPLGRVDTIITLCREEVCVTLPGIRKKETWIFPDPAAAVGGPEEILQSFRLVRDGIKSNVFRLS